MYIALGILVLVLIIVGVIYNQLISLRNSRKQAFSDIDSQTKLRYDLIPNLVNIVKGYAKHEDKVFKEVTEARNMAMHAGTPGEKAKSENMLQDTLKSLFAVAESYPELKANQNFLELQRELSDVEDKIAAARRFFNNATKEYNTLVESFPHILIAKTFGFSSETFFEVGSEVERENISVKL